jgi:hypothetical protein
MQCPPWFYKHHQRCCLYHFANIAWWFQPFPWPPLVHLNLWKDSCYRKQFAGHRRYHHQIEIDWLHWHSCVEIQCKQVFYSYNRWGWTYKLNGQGPTLGKGWNCVLNAGHGFPWESVKFVYALKEISLSSPSGGKVYWYASSSGSNEAGTGIIPYIAVPSIASLLVDVMWM